MVIQKPWIIGPKELLLHAEEHISINGKSGFDLRIAMISIDNAIETMTKTYLGLPERARGRKGPPRKKLEEAFSFPDLIDLLEEYASDLIHGIELSDIEWYHRIRNNLYHNGNGITVDNDQVRSYFQIAKILFESLFDTTYKPEKELPKNKVAIFLEYWLELERRLQTAGLPYFSKPHHTPPSIIVERLYEKKVVDEEFVQLFRLLQNERNGIVHGIIPKDKDIHGLHMVDIMNGLNRLIGKLPNWKKE